MKGRGTPIYRLLVRPVHEYEFVDSPLSITTTNERGLVPGNEQGPRSAQWQAL